MFNQCLHALYFCNPEICIHHHRIMKRKSLLKAIQIKSCPLFSPSFSFSLLFFAFSDDTIPSCCGQIAVFKGENSEKKVFSRFFNCNFSQLLKVADGNGRIYTKSLSQILVFTPFYFIFFSGENLRKSFADLSSG